MISWRPPSTATCRAARRQPPPCRCAPVAPPGWPLCLGMPACSQDRPAKAFSVWCQEELACARAGCRRRTQRSAPNRNRTGRLGKRGKSCRKNRREYFSRRLDNPRARIWTWDAGSHRRWDAGSRQRRRHRILQGAHLRRQQGELTGYSFQIRLLGCGALRERRQHVGVLLLR